MDTLCKLIQIIAGVSEQGNQFLQLRQLQLNYIPINRHLTDKGRKIGRAELLHLLLDRLQLIRGHADDFHDITVSHGDYRTTSFLFAEIFGEFFTG